MEIKSVQMYSRLSHAHTSKAGPQSYIQCKHAMPSKLNVNLNKLNLNKLNTTEIQQSYMHARVLSLVQAHASQL
jgi:hypothetical protein